MIDVFTHKEYKLPNGRTVTAYFNELGEARVTIEAMDYLMDMINSLVEVVRKPINGMEPLSADGINATNVVSGSQLMRHTPQNFRS